jgi:hypothetical protein
MWNTQIRLPECGPINILATAYTHAITDRNSVKKPTAKDINKAPAKSRWIEDTPDRVATFIKKIAATEERRSNNASPGPPRGNMENNLCTELRVLTFVPA